MADYIPVAVAPGYVYFGAERKAVNDFAPGASANVERIPGGAVRPILYETGILCNVSDPKFLIRTFTVLLLPAAACITGL